MASTSLRGAIYGITAASIWGGVYVASDFVLRTIPPFTLLVIRIVIGASILAAILKASRQPLILPRRDTLRLLGVGIVGFGISLAAQFIGTKLATSVNGSVVTSASPAFILLFAALILHEPLNLTRIGAVVVASIGVLIVFDLSALNLSSTTFEGNIILVIAALTWAAYSVLVRLVSANYSTLTISFYALMGGLILALPASALELRTEPIGEITPLVMVGILYLGVISTSLAMFMWNRAFALVEASVASLFFFAQPLVGVLLSNLLLNYPIKPQVLIGGALIIGGVLLSMQKAQTQREEANSAANSQQATIID